MSTSTTLPSEIVWSGILMWMARQQVRMSMSDLLDSLPADFLHEPQRVTANHLTGTLMGARVDVQVEARKPERVSVFNQHIQPASNWQTSVRVSHPKFRAHVALRHTTGKLWFLESQQRVQCYSSKSDMEEFNQWLAMAKLSGHPWFSGLNEQTIAASAFRMEDRTR